MLEVIINQYEVNCTTKNEIYTEYYAERKPTSMSVRKSVLRCPGFLV